jgi:hypothetical protein
VPPQSLEAEESVLGGVLLDNTAIDRVLEFVRPDDFSIARRTAGSSAPCSRWPRRTSPSTW